MFLPVFNTLSGDSTDDTTALLPTPFAAAADDDDDDDDGAAPGPKVLAEVKLARTITRTHWSHGSFTILMVTFYRTKYGSLPTC